jgi:hypothetical protein
MAAIVPGILIIPLLAMLWRRSRGDVIREEDRKKAEV